MKVIGSEIDEDEKNEKNKEILRKRKREKRRKKKENKSNKIYKNDSKKFAILIFKINTYMNESFSSE
jgi:hypothetical protein